MGERSIMAGKIKLHRAGLSTTLTKIWWALAAAATAWLVSALSVAEMTSIKPRTSSAAKTFSMAINFLSNPSCVMAGLTSREMTVTFAPARNNKSILRAAILPAPMTRQGRSWDCDGVYWDAAF